MIICVGRAHIPPHPQGGPRGEGPPECSHWQHLFQQHGTMNNLLDNMNNPNYINVLKPQMMAPGQQQMQPRQMQQPMMGQQQFVQGANPMMNAMGQNLMGRVNNGMQM